MFVTLLSKKSHSPESPVSFTGRRLVLCVINMSQICQSDICLQIFCIFSVKIGVQFVFTVYRTSSMHTPAANIESSGTSGTLRIN